MHHLYTKHNTKIFRLSKSSAMSKLSLARIFLDSSSRANLSSSTQMYCSSVITDNNDDTNKAATVVKNYLEIRLLFMETIQSSI
jgi:hypothetical protein